MQISIAEDKLLDYVRAQVNAFFPDGSAVTRADLAPGFSTALSRLENCFLPIKVRRYCADGRVRFNHLYSDQYLMFLWFLSNSLWKAGAADSVLNKLYLLNKCLHAFDCAFDTGLPDVFIVVHGVGTVLGKASYSDYFAVYQGCTVGQTNGIYPAIGRGVGLGAGASIIGRCQIRDFVSVGTGCTLVNTDIDSGVTVYRDERSGRLVSKEGRPAALALDYFNLPSTSTPTPAS